MAQLTELARELNAFVAHIKTLRTAEVVQPAKTIRETPPLYLASETLFTEEDLTSLST